MVKVIVKNELEIHGKLPKEVENHIKKSLTFTNPEYQLAERQRRSTYNISPSLSFYKQKLQTFFIPRGFSAQILKTLRFYQVTYEVDECTRVLTEENFSFCGTLYPFQQQAVINILSRRFGVLNSPTGSGKTVMALKVIAERKQPALVICHTKELLHQWCQRAAEFLQLTQEDMGIIGDGKRILGKKFTVAIVNSLYKCIDEVYSQVGFLVVDECHRVPSRTFTDAIQRFDSKYMLGLSATAYRRDKLTRVIYFYMGDSVYSIDPKELQKHNKIMQAKLFVRETNFDSEVNASEEYQALIQELVDNTKRNEQIIDDVILEAKNKNGICLVLSDRKKHCKKLYEMIAQKSDLSVELLTGSVTSNARKKIVANLDQIDILVASGRLVGEGFDCKLLSSLFLATPVKFSGRIVQYLGRILRTCEGKVEPKIYDYIDIPGVLRSSFKSRLSAYQSMGVIIDNLDDIEL